MVKASIGVAVLVVLFTLSVCKSGMALETSPIQQQGIVGGETIGEGQGQMVGDAPGIGDQAPAPHPDKIKEKKAIITGSGTMSNPGNGQSPVPLLVPEPGH